MKKVILPMLIALLTGFQASAQKKEHKAIEKVVQDFAKAGDNNDTETLQQLLDPNYRIVMNRLFGSKEVSSMPRQLYLDKIGSKEFGGDTRKVNIHQIIINGNTAIAQVTFEGLKMTTKSFLLFAQGEDKSWKLVSDTPTIQ